MTNEQIKQLRLLAESATPGPWKSSGTKLQKGTRNICSHVNAGEQLPIGVDIERGISNAAFIAAANPVAILSLLDRVKALEEGLTNLMREFPTDFDMKEAGWDSVDIERACSAHDAARVLLENKS